MAWWRAILALTRPWALPTIWSNCLAGWWLGGAGDAEKLPFLFGGATCLYFGGVFLNDAFDVSFDRQFQRARPIPAGGCALKTVWKWGIGWLVAGALLLMWAGVVTGSLGLAVVLSLILFNALHRYLTVAPVLLGICRFFLYVIGASVAARGVTGWAIWCGLALGIYVIGLECLARSPLPKPRRWPVSLLAVPILLAALMNADGYREPALLLSAVVGLWCLRAFRPAFWTPQPDLRQTGQALVAGIVLVDWLSSSNGPRELSFIFIGLFLFTLVLQQVVQLVVNQGRRAPI